MKLVNLREIYDFTKIARLVRSIPYKEVYNQEMYGEPCFSTCVSTISPGEAGFKYQLQEFYRIFFGEERDIIGDEDYVEETYIEEFFKDKALVEEEMNRIFEELYPELPYWEFSIEFNEGYGDLEMLAVIPFKKYYEYYGED